MSYSTLEDARDRERELLSLARKHRIGSEPRRERRSIFRPNQILAGLRKRYAPARTPAVGRAG
jgi:hypothetical protein